MNQELVILLIAAASIGFFHTLFGPDHYLPFIVMSKARKWSMFKTAWLTVLCGLGHVGSSIVLGIIGVAFGLGISNIEIFESFRGNIAAWLFIAFGLGYMIWGIKRAIRNKPHTHIHVHSNGSEHVHEHIHGEEHLHVHKEGKKNLTPWILFTIFVFGPCEPLIPILMYPAAKSSMMGMLMVTIVFSVVTILTMLSVVLISSYGIKFIPLGKMEKYSHAIAGATILLSGIGIQFLGL
ncbi:MAG: sulfite exporter TauE/SafE family protein [Bacteroidales bacterium]|nr:sulfite exporter TauE/SafE family protein [Bacteroidales bacterium]